MILALNGSFDVAFPIPSEGRLPGLIPDFAAQWPGLWFPLSTLQVRPHGTQLSIHSRMAAKRPHMTRGQRNWLILHCKTLSFFYFSPTLNGAIDETWIEKDDMDKFDLKDTIKSPKLIS